jgi:ABC-2 type transport system ATP-binding protein
MTALLAENLKFTYTKGAKPALDGFSLSVKKGTFCGLLGPNGAGKSTFLSIVVGLKKAAAGKILVQGFEVGSAPAKKSVGFVPQELALYSTLNAIENLSFYCALAGLPRKQWKPRMNEVLELVGLVAHAQKRVEQYSGGMKRRLNIAVALLQSPNLLILDEPTVGVDPQSRNLIHEGLKEVNRLGTTILYATHHLEEADKLCHDLAIVDQGRVVSHAGKESFKTESKTQLHRLVFERSLSSEMLQSVAEQFKLFQLVSDAEIEISIDENDEALGKLDILAKKTGNSIILFQRKQHSLESIFLQMTGRGLRD